MKTVLMALVACCAVCATTAAGEPPRFGPRYCLWGMEITYAVGQYGCGVALEDWDGDACTDIIAANGDGEVFVVPYDPQNTPWRFDELENNRLPRPTLLGKIPSKYPGADPVILEVKDRNADGKADILLRDRFGQDWQLLRVDRIKLGKAEPVGEPHKDWKRGIEFPRCRGRMIDRVGAEEVEVTGRPAGFAIRWLDDKTEYLDQGWGFAWHGRDGYDANFELVDLDGDGLRDLVTVAVARAPGKSSRCVLFHKGRKLEPDKMSLWHMNPAEVLFPDADVHNVLGAGDLDGDGDIDLVLSRMGFYVVWNEGTKTEPKFSKKIKVEGVHDEESVNLVDWDGDGLLDVVSSRWHDADHKVHVSFYRNLGRKAAELAFAEPAEILLGGEPIKLTSPGMCVVDLDADGDLDLVFCPYGGAVQWSENTAGKGARPVLAAPRPVLGEEGPLKFGARNNAIRVVDVNGDGKLDLLISSEYAAFDAGTEIVVWYGK